MVNSSPRDDFPSRPTVLVIITRLQIGVVLLRAHEALRRTASFPVGIFLVFFLNPPTIWRVGRDLRFLDLKGACALRITDRHE